MGSYAIDALADKLRQARYARGVILGPMPRLPSARRQSLALLLSQGLLIVGAALRLIEYLANRPFSIDESFLALNLIDKSPVELLHGLDFKQAAPLGFLEVEKLAVNVFGRSEYALRLLPLLASLASLVFFYWAGKKLLPMTALPFACAAFALLDPAIYYAATTKQYELDLAAAVALFALAASMLARPIGRRGFLSLAVAGAVVVWFSHASAFVLAAVGITLAAAAVARRSWAELGRLGVVAVIWVISLGGELQLSRSNISRIQQAFDSSQELLGTGKGDATWFEAATAKLRYLVGLEDTATGSPILGSMPRGVNEGLTVLLCLVLALGFLALARRRPLSALLLVVPPVLVLVASAFHKYPLVGRTLVFLLPSVALCLGEGLRVLVSGSRAKMLLGSAAAAAVLTALALLPAIHVVQQRASEGMRPALEDLGRHSERGDTLYVGHLAQYGFVYYHRCKCAGFDPAKYWPFGISGGPSGAADALIPRTRRLVLGAVNLPEGNYRPDVRSLTGRRRVWILVSEIPQDRLEPFLTALRRQGRELREFGPYGVRGTAVSLYLFDLVGAS
jgi:hypothetical protein